MSGGTNPAAPPWLEVVAPRWEGLTCIVAAPGPSLTEAAAGQCRAAGLPTTAVNDAWRRLPWADVLYGCDSAWWKHHNGCPAFNGERWTTQDDGANDKTAIAAHYGLHCVAGNDAVDGFSTDPAVITYGGNSGYQAVNLAILLGAVRIVLVGFDMHGTHFFGRHPDRLRNEDPGVFIPAFQRAAKRLPPGVSIVNATPGSALRCFPLMPLEDAIRCPQPTNSARPSVPSMTGPTSISPSTAARVAGWKTASQT